jgi:hypothetical protein
MTSPAKTDNRSDARAAKLELRAHVRELIAPCRVFEAFCGPSALGGMSEAWAGAELHVGCDQRFAWPDPRQRYVGDTHRVLRGIDLGRYNIFDLDAYGSPWTAMLILLARRRWAAGERGAIVLTDGSGMKSKFGMPGRDVVELLGMRTLPPQDRADVVHGDCTAAWLARAGVKQLRRWVAVSRTSGQPMVYSAVVFEGTGLGASASRRDDRQLATATHDLWD